LKRRPLRRWKARKRKRIKIRKRIRTRRRRRRRRSHRPVKIIAGLGNPGARYQWTRHNAGFQALDRLAESKQILVSTRRFKSVYGRGRIGPQEVLLVKPSTFMNLSGEAVKRVVDFFCISLEDLIVVHDDLDLPLGKLRFKQRGGDGGHQGIRSIIESLGSSTFLRLKIGIDRPPEGVDPADYVLQPLSPSERLEFNHAISWAAESLEVLLLEGLPTVMNRFQRRISLPSQSP
jgi:PTH1 family peptidyl-tRNA hydrolase